MSYAYNRRKKERRKSRSTEEKEVARKIRSGLYPRFLFRRAKLEDGHTEILEPKRLRYFSKGEERAFNVKGLTLRLVSTLKKFLE